MSEETAAGLDRTIRMIDIALAIGRYVVLVLALFVIAMIALAAYSFTVGSIAGGVISSLFALGTLILLAQILQRRRRGYRRVRARRAEIRQKEYRETKVA
jgi:protein-S-isoprenylcysteine O-methyltransferase Ste14